MKSKQSSCEILWSSKVVHQALQKRADGNLPTSAGQDRARQGEHLLFQACNGPIWIFDWELIPLMLASVAFHRGH